jgi:hypothetical protein
VGIDASTGSRFLRGDSPQRIGARTVQIEVDERRRVFPHLVEGGAAGFRESHRHAELPGGRFDLGHEHQVVDDC